MFWKKKSSDGAIDVVFDTSDKRRSYRVKPLPGFAPVALAEISGDNVVPLLIRDISTGGFSCQNSLLSADRTYVLRLRLPNDEREIHCRFRALSAGADGAWHCRFVDLSRKSGEMIYRYVLEVQKREIRGKI